MEVCASADGTTHNAFGTLEMIQNTDTNENTDTDENTNINTVTRILMKDEDEKY